MPPITVKRLTQRVLADPRRVIARHYEPGNETIQPGMSRAHLLLNRILAIPEADVEPLLSEILEKYSGRHRSFPAILHRNFTLAFEHIANVAGLSDARKVLIGAYFTNEYSIEAAALFNPSIVLAPDQSNLASMHSRIIMSLRAVGEGHISSIEFRTGILDADANLILEPASKFAMLGSRTRAAMYDKVSFIAKLTELKVWNDIARAVINPLPAAFNIIELNASLAALKEHGPPRAIWFETAKVIHVLATSSYETTFPVDSDISERVLFPAGSSETRGMEDARFVQFADSGASIYYATYTAYDGFQIASQLIETHDFLTFRIAALGGNAATNKGMALFPRKVGGRYAMLSRQDRENLFVVFSEDVHVWNDAIEVYRPRQPWELLHLGNCGSPLETEAGWLVIMHGVGPLRQYALGALLLDLQDPSKVLGFLREPLLIPDATEREGYVPNVLYTCGAIIHAGQLLLPYGFSDTGVAFALVPLQELITELLVTGY
jgi:predicted GH43/DUF377 family glycosyl hydrolase